MVEPSLDQDFENQPTTRSEQLLNNSQGMRLVGWLLIVGGAMCSIFIWTGLRVGSELWLWTSGASVLLGLICLAVAYYLKTETVEETVEHSDHIRAA